MVWYGWWEEQTLSGNETPEGPVGWVTDLSSDVTTWVQETGPVRLGLLLAGLLAVVVVVAWGWRASRPARRSPADVRQRTVTPPGRSPDAGPLLVAGGGAVGAACRWARRRVDRHERPRRRSLLALLVVNVIGSALLAAAIVRSRRDPGRASLLVDGVGTGFCGGLTTFSAFAVTTAEQLRAGQAAWAVASVVAMLVAGIGGRRPRARPVRSPHARPRSGRSMITVAAFVVCAGLAAVAPPGPVGPAQRPVRSYRSGPCS